ncbi:PPE domain-containing protein [Actinophytocola sp.]|uniref:PPE domain-containing protein n=1 Tax=Actinophytocola sp. TaxID=1872138 RepID=UPI002ED41B59
MSRDHGVSDIRFEGYSNESLAREVDALRGGEGSGSLQNAMSALVTIAANLLVVDSELREQLKKIGVSWQGEAADGGTSATENARIFAEGAVEPVNDSVRGIGEQSAAFHNTHNSAPDAGTLNGPTEETLLDQAAGLFGHTTDHAQQVKETNASRNQAIDAMNGYRDSSVDAINQARPLPIPPGMNLVAQPVDTSTHVSSVSGYTPGGSTFNPTGLPGGGGAGGTFAPGGPGGAGGGPLPTTFGPNTPLPGGTPPLTGTGPFPGINNPLNPAGPLPAALRAVNPALLAGDAATAMGSGAASGAGAGAERDRLAARNAAAKGSVKNGVPLGAAPEEESRAARNAERYGARAGRPGGSIMQPAAAATGKSAEGEDDQEHVRRYGVESSDVFDDDRVVAPESIGDDDDDR